MPHYLRLCRLTEKGLKKTSEPGKVFAAIEANVKSAGCKLEQAYVTTGTYDFVAIIEAPDQAAMKKYNELVEKMGLYTAKTMACFPAATFIQWADGEFSPFLNYWMQQRGQRR
jgi:uncharacterized protein with GYD domain